MAAGFRGRLTNCCLTALVPASANSLIDLGSRGQQNLSSGLPDEALALRLAAWHVFFCTRCLGSLHFHLLRSCICATASPFLGPFSTLILPPTRFYILNLFLPQNNFLLTTVIAYIFLDFHNLRPRRVGSTCTSRLFCWCQKPFSLIRPTVILTLCVFR